MTTKEELARWLSTLPANTAVWIDDGGLMIESDAPALGESGCSYLEVGGLPLARVAIGEEFCIPGVRSAIVELALGIVTGDRTPPSASTAVGDFAAVWGDFGFGDLWTENDVEMAVLEAERLASVLEAELGALVGDGRTIALLAARQRLCGE